MQALLKKGISVFSADTEANTPLHFAASEGHVGACRLLVEAGADGIMDNRHANSAYDLAIRNGRTAVRRIFEPSASDEDVTNLAMTGSLLLKAAWEGRDHDVRQELHKIKTSGNELSGDRMKVDVAADNKVTALHLAARGGHPVVVRLLADAKADLRAQSSKGCTALAMAAEEAAKETEALHARAEGEHAEAFEKRKRRSSKDDLSSTAVRAMASVPRMGHRPSVQMNSAGHVVVAADRLQPPMVGAQSSYGAGGRSRVTSFAASEAPEASRHLLVIEALLEAEKERVDEDPEYAAEVRWDASRTWRLTYTHRAIAHRPPLLPLQVAAEPEFVNISDENGITPLMLVCQYGELESVKLLLEYKADALLRSDDDTDALMFACRDGHHDTVGYLLSKEANLGLDINRARRVPPSTALGLAASY